MDADADVIKKTTDFVLKTRGNDVLFGFPHADNVRKSALLLAEKFGGNIEIVHISALLHDVAFNGSNYATHATESATLAKNFLNELEYDKEKIKEIVDIIRSHDFNSWRAQGMPTTIEQKIVSDAETIERISSLGIIRFIIVCRNQKMKNEELLIELQKFVDTAHKSLFFQKSVNLISFKHHLIWSFLNEMRKESSGYF